MFCKQSYMIFLAMTVLMFFSMPVIAQILTLPSSIKIIDTDINQWEKQAAFKYYQVYPQAIRHKGGQEEFLCILQKYKPTPKGEEGARFASYLTLARRDNIGKISIVWYKELLEDARSPIWLPTNNENDEIILLPMMGAKSYVYRINDQGEFKIITQFDDQHINLKPQHSIISPIGTNATPYAFFEYFSLRAINLLNGNSQELLPQPQLTKTISSFLGVYDFDKDGIPEIIGETASVTVVNKVRIKSPTKIHVWHLNDEKFQELSSSDPMSHWAIESLLLRTRVDDNPVIITNEVHETDDGNIDLYLHIYGCDGKMIVEKGDSKEITHGLYHDGFVVADLDGDGADEIVAKSMVGGTHLVVLQWKEAKFVQLWKSPRIIGNVEFGRIDDYDRDKKPEIALFVGNTKLGLFQLKDDAYIGWEDLVDTPVERTRVEVPNYERFNWEQFQPTNNKPYETYFILDGKRIFDLFPLKSENNPIFTGNRIQKKVLEALAKKIPADKVVEKRIIHDDGANDTIYYEIYADTLLITTLTADDAIVYKMPLEELAIKLRDIIKNVVDTLKTPKYVE